MRPRLVQCGGRDRGRGEGCRAAAPRVVRRRRRLLAPWLGAVRTGRGLPVALWCRPRRGVRARRAGPGGGGPRGWGRCPGLRPSGDRVVQRERVQPTEQVGHDRHVVGERRYVLALDELGDENRAALEVRYGVVDRQALSGVVVSREEPQDGGVAFGAGPRPSGRERPRDPWVASVRSIRNTCARWTLICVAATASMP